MHFVLPGGKLDEAMARQTAINTVDDMRWLREVHLPRLPAKYKSAIIVGNEDYPDRIEVYERRDPVVTDMPLVFEADEEGIFQETKQSVTTRRRKSTKRHHATKKSPAQLQREIDEALSGTAATATGAENFSSSDVKGRRVFLRKNL